MTYRIYRPYFTLLIVLFAAMSNTIIHAQPTSNAPSPPGSIQFMGETFSLRWESHPTPDHHLYEYFPPNQNRPRYHTMLLLDKVTNGLTPSEAVNQKMEFLKQRKGTDPVVTFDFFKHEASGEFILDFLVSENINGIGDVLEWDVYRYIPIPEGGILIGHSARAYNEEDGTDLLTTRTEFRQQIINALASLSVPQFSHHASKH